MTSPLRLSDGHLALLAKAIGQRPASDLAPKDRAHRRLAEHFELWNLLSCEPLKPGVRLASVAKFTGLTHHQIRSGRRAVQYALSARPQGGESGLSLHAVFTSSLAAKIKRAIEFVDQLPGTDHERARLLFVPSRHVYALWLYGDHTDRLVIASKPNMGGALAYRTVHSAEHFLAALSRRRSVRLRHEPRSRKPPVDVAPPP